MKRLKPMFIASICLIMSSCSLFSTKQHIIKTEAVQKLPLNIQEPAPIELSKVKFYVITPENQTEVFDLMQQRGFSLVLFGLTDDGYKSMSVNLIKIRNYVKEQQQIIKQYKIYYETPKQAKNAK